MSVDLLLSAHSPRTGTTGRAQSAMSDVQHPADPRWFYIGAN
jgi:hypothetical protein